MLCKKCGLPRYTLDGIHVGVRADGHDFEASDDPAPQPFAVEVNGPANVVMLIDVAQKLGQPANLEAIRTEAVRTIRYLEALGRGERPKWHTIKEQA